MLEVLQFIFQDFWHFFGILILLAMIFAGISNIIKSFNSESNKVKSNTKKIIKLNNKEN